MRRRDRLLFSACHTGDLAAVRRLVRPTWFAKGANVNARGDSGGLYEGETPLNVAIKVGKKDIVEALIAAGASVNTHIGSVLPIRTAVQLGNREIVEFLIQKGASLKNAGFTAVSNVGWGSMEGNYGTDGQRKRFRVRTADTTQWTLLTWSIERGNVDIAELLVLNGTDIVKEKVRGYQNTTSEPLRIALEKGYVPLAKMMLKRGAVVSHGTLSAATKCNDKELWGLLMEHGMKLLRSPYSDYAGHCSPEIAQYIQETMTRLP